MYGPENPDFTENDFQWIASLIDLDFEEMEGSTLHIVSESLHRERMDSMLEAYFQWSSRIYDRRASEVLRILQGSMYERESLPASLKLIHPELGDPPPCYEDVEVRDFLSNMVLHVLYSYGRVLFLPNPYLLDEDRFTRVYETPVREERSVLIRIGNIDIT